MSLRRRTMTLFGLLYTFSTSASVIEQGIVREVGGKTTAKICLDKKESVSFKVGKNGIEQSFGIEESKGPKASVCYTKSYSPGVVSEDQFIYAVINQSSFLIQDSVQGSKQSQLQENLVTIKKDGQSIQVLFDFSKKKNKILSVTVKSVETNEFAESVVLRNGNDNNTIGDLTIDLNKLSDRVKSLIVYNDNGEVVQEIKLQQLSSKLSKSDKNSQSPSSDNSQGRSSLDSKAESQNQDIADQKEIIVKASQSAEKFAKQFALAFGSVENIKFNFYLAKKQMDRRFDAIGGDILIQSDISSGEIQGVRNAQMLAEQNGLKLGQSDAKDAALDRVILQWKKSLGKESLPQVDKSLPELPTKIFQIPSEQLKLDRVDSRLEKVFNNKGILSQLILETQRNMDSDLKFAAIRNAFYDDVSEYQLTESFFSSDYMSEVTYQKYQWKKIFDLWTSQELTDANLMDVLYFKNLDKIGSANSQENMALFKSVFLEKLEQVLQKKWRQIVTKENKLAQSFAEEKYLQAVHSYSYDYGYVRAYQKAYQIYAEASYVRAFKITYPVAYLEKFNQVENSSLLGDVSGYVMSSNQQQVFGVGDDIYFVLQSAANYGGAKGEFPIELEAINFSNSGQFLAYPKQLFNLSARTKMNQPMVFKIAQIGKDKVTQTDGRFQVTVKVGDRKVSLTELKIQWEKSVLKGITSGDATVLGYLRTKLFEEYKSIGVTNNDIYVKPEKLKNSLFYRMKTQLLSLNSPSQRAYAVKVVKYFQSAYGARPSGWFDTSKDDYDTLMKEYSQLLSLLSR